MNSGPPKDFAPDPLIDMAIAGDVAEAFSGRATNRSIEVFAADGSVLFDDPYSKNCSPAPMAFAVRDSFTRASVDQPQSRPIETTFKEPDLKSMSLHELQELHRRISQVHASLTQEGSGVSNHSRIERG